MELREFIAAAVYAPAELDAYLDPDVPSWARFDAELGYVPGDCVVRDGVDGSSTLSSYDADGQRHQVNYAGGLARISSYGDSMTQCHQVSDGETWQEQLAAHLGEPIRNFGVGGYGVYQAYRRLLREETRYEADELVLFNIYSGDHTRSLDAWRWLRIHDFRAAIRAMSSGGVTLVHGNPWAHLRLDLDSGRWDEIENLFPTEQSLYRLCDPEFVCDAFAQDQVVQLIFAGLHGRVPDAHCLDRLAEALEVRVDWSDAAGVRASARRLHQAYGWAASLEVLARLRANLAGQGKRLLLLLTYTEEEIARACEQPGWRPDEAFFAAASAEELPVHDALAAHRADFRDFDLSGAGYAARYLEGHYTPAGNQFYAFAIKDALLGSLASPPPAYGGDGLSLQEAAAILA